MKIRSIRYYIVIVVLFCVGFSAFADEEFNRLISSKKYQEALAYAEEKLPSSDRDDDVWVKLGTANSAVGLGEKALACYLVAWRLNAKNYSALYGISKVYNDLNQPDNAITWAQKAIDINFTAEASWEYARACISLKRAPEAKKALEKVIETDPANEIANKELGKIYFDEKAWKQALPLLKKSSVKKVDPVVLFQIGKASLYSSLPDSAIHYLSKSVSGGGPQEAALELARAYYTGKNYEYALRTYSNISKSLLDANDLYRIAFCKEVTTGKDAWADYNSALEKFGQAKSLEALKSREKVGLHMLSQKKFSDAIKHFQFIVQSDKDAKLIPDSYILLADGLSASGNSKEAVRTLEQAISVNGKNVEAYVRLGNLYAANGNSEKAKQTFETLIGISPDDPSIYLKLGAYNNKAQKYKEAIGQFEKSLSLEKSADGLAGIAVAQFKLGNKEKAIENGLQALEIEKGNIDANTVLAAIYFEKKDYGNALKNLEYLVKNEPLKLENLEKLATCYLNVGNNDKLFEVDRKIAGVDSKNIESRMRLAKRADSLAIVDSAYMYYVQLSKLSPTNSFVYNRLFRLAIQKKQQKEAADFFKKYTAIKADDAVAFRDYGDFLYELKDFDNALTAYRKALAIDPKLKGFHKRYAEIVISKGQVDEVVSALSVVVKSGEADLSTYTTLGMIYQKKKMYVKAIEMFQNALKIEPDNADVLTSLAASQALSKNFNAAVISYEQVVMMNDKAVDEYKELGAIYIKLKRTNEAIKAYKKYIEKKPSDNEVLKILGENAYVNKEFSDVVTYLGKLGLQADVKYLIMFSEACVATEKFESAIAPLEKVKAIKNKIDKNDLQTVLKLLAQTYEKVDKDQKAVETYAEYLALKDVQDPDIAYKYATLIEKKDTVNAIKAYENNSKRYPADYRNFLKAGLLLAGKKETLEKSVTLLKRVTELASSIPEVWLELGRAYGKMHRYNEELESYMKYSESNPQSAEANSRIGSLLIQKGKTNEGIVYMEVANTLTPDNTEIMMTLASGYLRTNRPVEAINLLEKAKKLQPDNKEISLKLFDLYVSIGKNDEAKVEIEALIEPDRDIEYLIKYADFLSETGKQKDALKVLEEVLAIEEDNFEVLLLKAKLLRKDKKADEAIEIYKAIGEFLPDHVPSMFGRAEAYLEMANPRWAETFYKRVLRADPQFALAELGLAKVAKLKNDTAMYKEHLERALAIDPNNKLIKEEIAEQVKN